MPLLTVNDLEKMSKFFRGRFGNILGHSVLKILAIDKINELYDRNYMFKGPEFTEAVLKDIGIDYEIIHKERLQELPEGAFITISNHPYGSIDGVMLVNIFGHIRPDFKVMVNNILGRIESLDENFICVTPTGEVRTDVTSESLKGIKTSMEHIRNGHCLGIFPSGAVSDLSIKDRCIRDRQWQEPVIRLIKKLRVPIVPVHFMDRNSDFYYSLGLIDWRIRLLRLPSEVFNKAGKRTRIEIKEIISTHTQDEYDDLDSFRIFLRNCVYGTQACKTESTSAPKSVPGL